MKALKLIPIALGASILAACGGGGGSSGAVVDEQRVLAEGVQLSYDLPAGTYSARITASQNGVGVKWVGGSDCLQVAEATTYTSTCHIAQSGQLVVTNPTLLGLGSDEIVTVRVTKN